MLDDLLFKGDGRPRLAIIVAAWDELDATERASAPIKYIEKQFPLSFSIFLALHFAVNL